MRRTRVKICGIRQLEDALTAIELGADALGFNFYEKSQRFIEPVMAAKIRKALPPFVSIVALVVDQEPEEITDIIRTVGPDLIQFHGEEENSYCRSFGLPFLKVIRLPAQQPLPKLLDAWPDAAGLLLDTRVKGMAGGTGQVFDWSLVPRNLPKPLILAGGLNATNVGEAIAHLSPYAVDVSSGVETGGFKDTQKMSDFMAAVKDAV